MYYSTENYEALVRPLKPAGVDRKSAYLTGTGLPALAAACYLVRDGQMKGEHVHIFERGPAPTGSRDGFYCPGVGYVLCGSPVPDDAFEEAGDLLHSIPSQDTPGASLLDEYYWLNKKDPNGSLCRTTEQRGRPGAQVGRFNLSDHGCFALFRLYFTPDERLYGKQIGEVLDEEVFRSEFWLYWSTTFGFGRWHSALEMKRYFARFLPRIEGLKDFKGLRLPRYNQYESLALPMIHYLEGAGVRFHYNTAVVNVEFECTPGKKQARSIELLADGCPERIDLTENDLVFLANGDPLEHTAFGGQDQPARTDAPFAPGDSWELWQRVAVQDSAFGSPKAFCSDPRRSGQFSATVTTFDERIVSYIRAVCGRDPFLGRAVTGGPVTARDSAWLLSWSFSRQPQFRHQPKGQLVGRIFAQRCDRPGDYVRKPVRDCTGREICMEWLYHLGVPEGEIAELAARGANTVPVYAPYATAALLPCAPGDRPAAVPEGAVNFAFLGPFARAGRGVSTAEGAMRTGMEAVYALLGIDRGVPALREDDYGLRELLDASVQLRDGRSLLSLQHTLVEKLALGKVLDWVKDTDLGQLLREYQIL